MTVTDTRGAFSDRIEGASFNELLNAAAKIEDKNSCQVTHDLRSGNFGSESSLNQSQDYLVAEAGREFIRQLFTKPDLGVDDVVDAADQAKEYVKQVLVKAADKPPGPGQTKSTAELLAANLVA